MLQIKPDFPFHSIFCKRVKVECRLSAHNPQVPGAGWGFNELNQEVRHHQGGWGHSPDHPPCLDKSQNSGFLRKSIFLILGGP